MILPKSSILSLNRLEDIGADRNEKYLLDKNERTTPFPQSFIDNFTSSINHKDLIKYPDQSGLYKKLAKHLDLEQSQILLTPGSDNGIKIVFDTYIESGNSVNYLDPTYAMVDVYARMYGCVRKTVAFENNLSLSIPKLLDSISTETRILFLANPNQPTGTLIPLNKISDLLDKANKTETLTVIDEAYIEFTDSTGALDLINHYDNLCVLRTFSKAWGLAGLRLGYIASNPSVIHELKKVKSLLDINSIAMKFLSLLLDNTNLVEDNIKENKRSQEYLQQSFCELNIEFIATQTNFMYFRPPDAASSVDLPTHLRFKGFVVRNVANTNTMLDGCIRITTGSLDQMKSLVTELRSILLR